MTVSDFLPNMPVHYYRAIRNAPTDLADTFPAVVLETGKSMVYIRYYASTGNVETWVSPDSLEPLLEPVLQ